jgi:hypothetical protein
MVSNYNIYWALDIQDQNTLMLLTEGFSSHYKSNQYDKQGFRYDQNITEISLPFQWDENIIDNG